MRKLYGPCEGLGIVQRNFYGLERSPRKDDVLHGVSDPLGVCNTDRLVLQAVAQSCRWHTGDSGEVLPHHVAVTNELDYFRSVMPNLFFSLLSIKIAWPAEMGITFLGLPRATDGCASRPINLTVQCVIPYSTELYTGRYRLSRFEPRIPRPKRCRAGQRERLCFFSLSCDEDAVDSGHYAAFAASRSWLLPANGDRRTWVDPTAVVVDVHHDNLRR